jgi:hypothetical protein
MQYAQEVVVFFHSKSCGSTGGTFFIKNTLVLCTIHNVYGADIN